MKVVDPGWVDPSIGVDPGGSYAEPSDHGLLTGLADDDHPQYLNQARGDARYSLLTHLHTGVYSPVAHNHTGTYAPFSHTHQTGAIEGLDATILDSEMERFFLS